ncbi:vasorin-like [Patiria miniata]|uniref:Uncharacterized protein n=1 Tax=Patiria miniata TaxID=46514 RepID=A0A913ZI84_PATMI|nr:vasorin-like [Patiria miniata]
MTMILITVSSVYFTGVNNIDLADSMVLGHLIILILSSQVITSSAAPASQDASCNTTCGGLDANCVNQALTNVPLGCSPFIEMMDLRENNLKYLRPDSFMRYRHLVYLDLAHNKISNIAAGAFEGCVSLKKVYLQENLLTEVGEGTFEGASNLNGLFLNANKILRLLTAAFHGLDNLQYLDISDNDLQSLPLGIFDDLGQLKFLSLENNNLQSLQGSLFDGLVNLKKLILSRNDIVSITGFPSLPNLKTLDLFNNDLQDITDLADKINGLDHLYLGENHNIICMCSINSVRVWLQSHRSDEAANRVDVTCHAPQHLHGLQLHNISKYSLCPRSNFTPSLSTTENSPSKKLHVASTLMHVVNMGTMEPVSKTVTFTNHTKQKKTWDGHSKPHSIIMYVTVGTGALLIIIFFLILLNKCLGMLTRRNQQQNRNIIPDQQKAPQQEQSVPMMHITVNRFSQNDGANEVVQPRTPANDSAFGSQADLDVVTEMTQLRQDPIFQAVSTNSDDPFYMSIGDLNAPHCSPPPGLSKEDDLPPLEQEWPTTNPFLRDLTHNNQAYPSPGQYVPRATCTNASRNATPPMSQPVHQLSPMPPREPLQSVQAAPQDVTHYIPHCQMFQSTIPTQTQMLVQTPEHSLQHLNMSESTNPFKKATSKNPFTSCS